ncbi:MAG: hypothetical protein IT182_12890 [Acidobacteria bacterium]|nr:hypothetical protein [Acidobacteriota bacterium]
MSDVEEITRASQLWKMMTDGQRRAAAEAFWSEGEAGAEHAEIVGLLSRRLNFRVKSVLALPLEKKAKYTAGLAAVSDGVAGRLLVTFHLAKQRPMMGAFLDVLGVTHEDGLISDESAPAVDQEKLPAAVQAIREAYPVEDVNLYLHTLRLQDHATWGGVGQFL